MRMQLLPMLAAGAVVALGCGVAGNGGGYQIDDDPLNPLGQVPAGCLESVWVPGAFDFRMAHDAAVEVVLSNEDGTPRGGVLVSVYDSSSTLPGEQALLARGVTGDDGYWSGTVSLPAGQTEVNVVADFFGASNNELVPVIDGFATIELGG